MPELPEVEILVRHLRPRVVGQVIHQVEVGRPKIIAPGEPTEYRRRLLGARILDLHRRGKYLKFLLATPRQEQFMLLGHLGMTGRMYVAHASDLLPKHLAVALWFAGKQVFIFEDMRFFGRLTLDTSPLEALGPEPLEPDFTLHEFQDALLSSKQPIKVKLLDQGILAGLGNIYASESLFAAGIHPAKPACHLNSNHARELLSAIRTVLRGAIRQGSTIPLDFAGLSSRNRLFYFGTPDVKSDFYEKRLRVYDREGQPCRTCGRRIVRIVQAGRSTFLCPRCQKK